MLYPSLSFRSGLWTPEKISTVAWLDASDAATITTVASKVSQWNDKSGNGRNCAQSTDSLRPTYVTNSFNGKNVVRFPGAYFFYLDFVTTLPLQNTATIFVVCENEIQHSVDSIWKPIVATTTSDFTGTPAGYALGKKRSNAAGMGGKAPSNGGVIDFSTAYSASADTFEILGMTCNENVIQARRNGESVFDSSALIPRTSGWTTNYRIGAEVISGFNRYFTGDLCEVVICNTVPSLLITQRIEGYLAHKWGLTSSLPIGHPYKTALPY